METITEETVPMETIVIATQNPIGVPNHDHPPHPPLQHRQHQQLGLRGRTAASAATTAAAAFAQFALRLNLFFIFLCTTSAQFDLFTCNFEGGSCGLILDPTGNFQWLLYAGKTPTEYTGPSSGQGGSYWYFYVESSAPRLPNDQARFTTSDLNFIGDVCVRFYYNAYGQGVGQLVLYTQVGSNYTSHVDRWHLRGDQGFGWKFQWFELYLNEINARVGFNGIRGSNWLGDIGVDTIRVFPGKCVPDVFLPWTCDFESDELCGTRQRNDDDFEWLRLSGATPTPDTGPEFAQSGAYYVYIETSEPIAPGAYAALESPIIVYSGEACVVFWYNMYGNDTGSLSLYTLNRGQLLPWRSWLGNSGSQNWTEARVTVQLTNYNDRVGFIGVRGDDILGDIAIDNIRIDAFRCPDYETTETTASSSSTTITTAATTKASITTIKSSTAAATTIPTIATTNATVAITTTTTNAITTATTTAARTTGAKTTAATTTAAITTAATTTAAITTAATTTAAITTAASTAASTTAAATTKPTSTSSTKAVTTANTPTTKPTTMTTTTTTSTTTTRAVSFNNGTHVSLPWSCDFERDECGMEQMNFVNTLFTRHSGPSSPSGLTGASAAQSGLYYMFINSTTPRKQGDNALLETWYILRNGLACVRFWYHMYGADTGQLSLYSSRPGREHPWKVWSGDKGPQWFQAEETINITGDRVGIIAVVGPGPLGHIAVDNILITSRACNDTGPEPTSTTQTRPTPTTTSPKATTAATTTTRTQSPTSEPEPFQYPIVSCDMESNGAANTRCRLRQDTTDAFDWTVQSNETPSGKLSTRTISNGVYPVTGPSGAKEGRFYLFTEASGTANGQIARLIAEGDDFMRSPGRRSCLRFSFSMNGFHTGTLRVYAKFSSEPTRVTQWEISGDKGNGWKSAAIDFNMTEVTEVGIEGIMAGEFSGDMAIDNLTMTIGQCQVLPQNTAWACSFELPDGSVSLCGMTQAPDAQYEWTLWSGKTPSDETGPNEAYSLPYFIYAEASDPRVEGDRAEILVPKLYQISSVCLSFYYNMNGWRIGSLEVYTVASGNKATHWRQSGNQGNVWLHAAVTLSLQTDDQIGFRGIRGGDFSGDIAVDSIVIFNGVCISS